MEERLETLRGLIERQKIYQARLARTALVGGTLSIFTATALFVNDEIAAFLDRPVRPREFAAAWIVVLAVTLVTAAMLAVRAPAGESAHRSKMRIKLLLAVIAPYVLIPSAFTAWFFGTGYLGGTELDLVVVWIAFYGLMLVGTAAFAPRSVVLLGWLFLLTAVGVPLLDEKLDLFAGDMPSLFMGLTFGVYHCIYAVFNWRANNPPP